ncbi:MAG: ABC transporter ATP-binding protein, partial [Spirochaetota bacterium]
MERIRQREKEEKKTMAGVVLKNVWKKYGKVEAVIDLNLEIDDKEFLCLLGPSGCGKSSTLRMIAGLEKMTSGEIFIDGKLINTVLPKDRDIAMAFENYALYPHMTVYGNIAFPLEIRGVNPKDIKKKVDEVAELLGITDLLAEPVKDLSGGAQQRTGVARALVRKPKVLLLDEPISHLEADLRAKMREELKRLQRTIAVTTIYVTHDQIEAMVMANRIAVMDKGRLLQLASPDVIYNHPNCEFVAGFIGEPPMNFLDCELADDDGNRIKGDQFEIELPDNIKKLLRKAAS